jgi:hypothetical protein
MNALQKITNPLAVVIFALPILWAIGLIALAYRAKIFLGYWPGPNRPDPQVVPFDTHYALLAVGMYANLVGLGIFFLFRRYLTVRFSPQSIKNLYRIFTFGWLAIFSLTFIPGIKFVGWFLD